MSDFTLCMNQWCKCKTSDYYWLSSTERPELITAGQSHEWGGVKERTITLIIRADWFCMRWHPSTQSIVPICGQAGCRTPKCLFITMTKCKWPTLKSLCDFPPHLHKVAHETSSLKLHTGCKKFYGVLTETWSVSSDVMLDCISPCKGINSFPRASVMFNSCTAAAKFLVWFNDFWMVWLRFWKAPRCELLIETSICFHRMMMMMLEADGDGHKYLDVMGRS